MGNNFRNSTATATRSNTRVARRRTRLLKSRSRIPEWKRWQCAPTFPLFFSPLLFANLARTAHSKTDSCNRRNEESRTRLENRRTTGIGFQTWNFHPHDTSIVSNRSRNNYCHSIFLSQRVARYHSPRRRVLVRPFPWRLNRTLARRRFASGCIKYSAPRRIRFVTTGLRR